MPVQLPVGLTPTPLAFEPSDILTAGQVVGYRFELLTTDEVVLGSLEGVSGGGVDWSAFTAVKGGGSLQVTDLGQDVDWLNTRIRPFVLLRGLGVEEPIEHGLGIFLPSAPKESWTSLGRSWNVELLDKCSVLDQDIVTDVDGNPVPFVAPVGANVLEVVIDLIAGVGEAVPAIEPDNVYLTSSMVWEVGTPVLKIINELLAAGGYSSLGLDEMGQFRVQRYQSPAQRDPVYSAEAPFVVGNRSVLSPSWERDRDIYSIPNRYVAIGQGSDEAEAPVAVATNTAETSPFSYQSRGRWITRVVTGVEATSQAELESRALMGLAQASSVTSGISLSHRFLPELVVNSTIRFTHPDAGLDLLCYVTKTSVPFKATELCKSEIQEAVV